LPESKPQISKNNFESIHFEFEQGIRISKFIALMLPFLAPMPGKPAFPDPRNAHEEGVVAYGGLLDPDWLELAYRSGLFPWYSEDEPILWWSPDPRLVLFPSALRVSKSMEVILKRNQFHVTVDTCFSRVIEACAAQLREGQSGTWIGPDMIAAYNKMHELGIAHSVEVWEGDSLVGGLYGLAIGNVFFGESMFSLKSNTSKTGFIRLVRWLKAEGYYMIDCQTETQHLASLGAETIARNDFLEILDRETTKNRAFGSWESKFEKI
jgi:leucyl/phenylalanyl-tRNA---protein transferase